MQRVHLGRTGIEVSRLCIGTGTSGIGHQSNQTRKLGRDGLARMLVHAYEKGITWIDAADQYGSHESVADALEQVGRPNVVVTTKSIAQTAGWMKKDLDRFRRELRTDYIDIVLLHCLMHRWWNKLMRPVMRVLTEAKEKGIIRAVGCSNHNFGALQTTAGEPWVDVCLARLNPIGRHMEAPPEKVVPVLRRMKANGTAIYSMKVMAAGDLTDAREAIRWQLQHDFIDAMVIGMESVEEVDRNVDLFEELTRVPAT